MLPDAKGKVIKQARPGEQRYEYVEEAKVPMWRFGKPFDHLDTWVQKKKNASPRSLPTQVWITSLCSYWFESVAMMVTSVRKALPDAQIVLCGQYPELMSEHAAEFSAADVVVRSRPRLPPTTSSIDLYGKQKPPFLAITLDPVSAIPTILNGIRRDIFHYALFDDDICSDRGEPLEDIFDATKDEHKHIRFHVVCGLEPRKMTKQIAKTLADKRFSELHFEEAAKSGRVEASAYEKAMRYLTEAGLERGHDRTSGFVWMGRPGEKLDDLMQNAFTVLQHCENLILKPYSPTPGSTDHKRHAKYLDEIEFAKWSPHFFPFAKKNKIGFEEYHDMYRVAAFLNEKVRGRSFDFLKESKYGAEFLKESLRREVWTLDGQEIEEEERDYFENPLRIID